MAEGVLVSCTELPALGKAATKLKTARISATPLAIKQDDTGHGADFLAHFKPNDSAAHLGIMAYDSRNKQESRNGQHRKRELHITLLRYMLWVACI